MTATTRTRQLGEVCAHKGIRGRLSYLPDRGVIVVPETQTGSGIWHCGVIARSDTSTDTHVQASGDELRQGRTIVPIDPVHLLELYVMAWQAAVYVSFHGKAVVAVAVSERLRAPNTHVIPTNAGALRRLALLTHLMPIAVTRCLDSLQQAGFLSGELGQDMALTLP